MNNSQTSPLADQVRLLLENEPIGSFLLPQPQACSIAELSQEVAPEPFQLLLKRISFLEQKRPPIIGVCGTMNSGKSTLVRSFLSEAGGQRVLIGDRQAEGTHRFVFWLPSSWKADAELRASLLDFIHSAFEAQAEELSDDGEKAAHQYNARSNRLAELRVPLIAFDPKLDEANLAFLDCPDIQRSADETRNEKTAEIRREALQIATRLCSAFVVVSTPQQYGSETVGDIFATLTRAGGKLPVYFAVNMIPAGRDGQTYLEDVRKVLQRWNVEVKRIFGAENIHHLNPAPQFFDLADNSFQLSHLSNELAASQLEKEFRRNAASDALAQFAAIRGTLEEHWRQQDKTAQAAGADILDFLSDKFMSAQGDVRPLLSAAVTEALAESMERTAPYWIKPMFWLNSPVKSLREKLRGKKDLSEGAKDKFSSVGRDDFAHAMLGSSWVPAGTGKEQLTEAWLRALKALGGQTKLDHHKIDQLTGEAWDEMGVGAKIKAIGVVSAALIGALAAAAISPFDGGGSVVLYVVTLPELLAVAGLGYLANSKAVKGLTNELEKQLALPQLGNLYAGLQDGLGLPRDASVKMKRKGSNRFVQLHPPSIERFPAIIQILPPPVIDLDHSRLEQTQQRFSELVATLQENAQ